MAGGSFVGGEVPEDGTYKSTGVFKSDEHASLMWSVHMKRPTGL